MCVDDIILDILEIISYIKTCNFILKSFYNQLVEFFNIIFYQSCELCPIILLYFLIIFKIDELVEVSDIFLVYLLVENKAIIDALYLKFANEDIFSW